MTAQNAFSLIRNGMIGFALAATAMIGTTQLGAQTLGGHNSKAPVNFTADRIEVQDRANRVTLSGNVVIKQGGLTLRTNRALVDYTDAGSLQVQRLTATGGVNVTTANESAKGNAGVYDFNRRIITLAGNVGLSRGADRLSGARLVIDLRSGLSSVDGRSGPGGQSGRVSGSFTVPNN